MEKFTYSTIYGIGKSTIPKLSFLKLIPLLILIFTISIIPSYGQATLKATACDELTASFDVDNSKTSYVEFILELELGDDIWQKVKTKKSTKFTSQFSVRKKGNYRATAIPYFSDKERRKETVFTYDKSKEKQGIEPNAFYSNAITLTMNYGDCIGTEKSKKEQLRTSSEISVFPNPAKDNLIIKNLPKNVNQLVITDVNGRMISSFNAQSTIDISKLDVGMYFIQFIGEEIYHQDKFFKEK